jgi:excisionase family DNA binding protein
MTGVFDREIEALVRRIVAEELNRRLGEPQPNTSWLSITSAAKEADVSPSTIRRWIRRKELEVVGRGKLLRISRASLDRKLRGETEADPIARARAVWGGRR